MSQDFFCACIEKCYFSVMSNTQTFLIIIIPMIIIFMFVAFVVHNNEGKNPWSTPSLSETEFLNLITK